MAIADDISVAINGDIRYTGNAHGAAGAGYYTVIEFHRFLQDLADDAVASGDDLLDITSATPSDRSTDNIIRLLGTYNIDQTLSEHLYDGTIIQGSGGTEQIFDGIVVIASEGMDLQIIQNGALLTNDFWNNVPNGETAKGLNRDVANGISHRFMIEVRNTGADIDGRRLIGITRVTGKTSSEFKINGTARGNNVMALTYADDLNDTVDTSGYTDVHILRTSSTATVDGVNSTGQAVLNVTDGTQFTAGGFVMVGTDMNEYQIQSISVNALTLTRNLEVATTGGETIYDLAVGFSQIDVDNNAANEDYYAQWVKGSRSINEFYTRMKYISRTDVSNVNYIYGIDAKIFRGITHEIDVDTPTGTFAAVEAVSWPTGTGQMLAIDSPTAATKMWIQLLTGVAPVDGQTITGGISGATVDMNATITERPISSPFVGLSTGSAIIGSYGLTLQPSDLSSNDKVFDLTNSQITPPNNVTYTVLGMEVGADRLLVGPDTGSTALDESQFALNAGITSGAASLVVKAGNETPGTGTPSETDTPSSGTIRVKDNNGINHLVTYTGVTVGASTMTFTGLTGAPTANVDNDVFITYIDKLAASVDESFTTVFSGTNRNLFVRVRDAGTLGDNQAIKTFQSSGVLGSGGGSTSVIRTSDE